MKLIVIPVICKTVHMDPVLELSIDGVPNTAEPM